MLERVRAYPHHSETTYYMLDSSYVQGANPNSMRDQGICRNAVYNFDPCLENQEQAEGLNSFYNGQPEYMSSSYEFKGERERQGYLKSQHGDKEAQGVIEYPNQDLYSFGGKTRIHTAAKEAELPLDEQASNGFNYFQSAKGDTNIPVGVDKEYHEQVNDYQKNISNGIFSPGLSIEQYIVNRQERDPAYISMSSMKRAQSVGRVSRKSNGLRRHHTSHVRKRSGKSEYRRKVRQQRGHEINLAPPKNGGLAREVPMTGFTPCRPNAITRKPDEQAKKDFIKKMTQSQEGWQRSQARDVIDRVSDYKQSAHREVSERQSRHSHKSGKSVKSLSIALGKEKKRRRKLEAEVHDVKAQLTQLYDTLSNK